jgi:hypothetical protein
MNYLPALILISLLILPGARATTVTGPTAIIVSGGVDMGSNMTDFVADLDRGESVFHTFNRTFFYADGGTLAGAPNIADEDNGGNYLNPDHGIYPRFRRLLPKVAVTGSADFVTIQDQIIKSLSEMKSSGDASSPIVLYFTDHGGFDISSGEATISLWNNESMTEDQLKALIDLVPDSHTVEIINDHCYGAHMADAFLNNTAHPRANTCAVSAGSHLEMTSTQQGWMETAKAMQDLPPAQQKKYDLDHDGNISAREVINAMTDLNKMTSLPTTSSDTFASRYLAKAQKKNPTLGQTDSIRCIDPKDAITQLVDNSLKPVLKSMLDRYSDDLSVALTAAGLPTNISLQDLQRKIASRKAILTKKINESDRVGEQLGNATRAYVASKLGRKFKDYNDAVASVDQIETSLDVATTDADKKQLLANLQTAQKKLEPLDVQVNAIWTSASEGNDPGFPKFIRKMSGINPNEYSNEIISDDAEASKEVDGATDALRPLVRLSRDMTTLTALKNMTACGDSTALNEYLGLLACENTPIFKVAHE